VRHDGRAGQLSSGAAVLLCLLFCGLALPLSAREKDKLPYGEGLIVNIPVPESEVEQVVADIVQNGVIRGTKEYNKDEFVSGAKAATSTRVFPPWNEGGKVFYKVREQAIDPRNFKDTTDVGTIAVRYVVLAQGDKNTVLRIDAVFEEEFRHIAHQSNGSVEGAEYKDIQEHVEAIEVMKQQNLEAEGERQAQLAKRKNLAPAVPTPRPVSEPSLLPSEPAPTQAQIIPQAAESQAEPAVQPVAQAPRQVPSEQIQPGQMQPGQTLEEHVKELRKQVERLVKSPGAPLKSAPFHTASTLQSLTTGTEVLIVITTPYWYGVETHEGQHGWILRDELELP
jgi:hypothetical protein